MSIYRFLIVTWAPFPKTLIIETKLAKEAWHDASTMSGLIIQPTPTLVKLSLSNIMTWWSSSRMAHGSFLSNKVINYGKYFDSFLVKIVALILTVQFEEWTAAYKLLGKIGVDLLNVAQIHASVDPLMTAATFNSFIDDVFDDAI
ncbi:hypothetical protein DFH29DRAFT_879503 [Suillus ampliporus]|nr:hypothetical protein DFH29DRAFT_879503 [Suillus ampliporus]